MSKSSSTGTNSKSFSIGKLTIECDGHDIIFKCPNKPDLRIPFDGGQVGTEWHVHGGPPMHGKGKAGDLYMDTETQTLYKKNQIGDWEQISRIVGDQGPKGDRGAPGEDIGTGVNGVFDTVDGKRVRFSNGVITSITDIEE